VVSVPAPLRIVFFGTPAFAVPTLEALVAAGHHVVAAVAQPDRPRGRGQHVVYGAVKTAALAAGVPVLQPDRLKRDDFEAAFRALDAELGVVAAYGKILPQWLLDVPRLGMINVHASLLPRYRGAAPVHRAIIAGETETGVTIMRVVQALDAGPMIDRVVRAIADDDTSDVVERDLAQLGAALLVRTVDAMQAGRAIETPQDDALSTYAPRLTREDGPIDWSQPAWGVHNRIRGLHPWPHAFTHLAGERYILHRSTVSAASSTPETIAAPAGTIVEAAHGRLAVACGDGHVLDVLEIQAEGRRPMSAREFLAGRALTAGQQFETLKSN
jgi:methionyl-tRNA formyltransferase